MAQCGYGCGKEFERYRSSQKGHLACYQASRSEKSNQVAIERAAATEAPAPEKPSPVEQDLRDALNRALRKIDRIKSSKEELARAVYQAAADAAGALAIPPVPPAPKEKRTKVSETAIAILADWQLGKRTPTYDTPTCEARIEEYAEKVIRLTEIQRSEHPVRELRVYLLGDLVEGELIFPGQAHLIDASLFRQVITDGPRILGNFLRRMLSHFEKVHVAGVIGNHGAIGGRSRRESHPETNADAMMYDVTRQLLQNEKRLTWAPNMTPGERHWYAVDQVGSKAFFLFHGDQVKGGFAGWPWYGFGNAIKGWRMGGVEEPFNYSLSGHFHTPVRFLVGGITHWGAGSPESTNTYAAERLKAQGTPSQWLLFAHPERGVTAEYLVRLWATRRESA